MAKKQRLLTKDQSEKQANFFARKLWVEQVMFLQRSYGLRIVNFFKSRQHLANGLQENALHDRYK